MFNMVDEEEILHEESVLYKHLVDLGYNEFETYNSNEKRSFLQSPNLYHGGSVSRPSSNHLDGFTDYETKYHVPMSFYDRSKLTSIFNSKLLFVEDLDFVEQFLSTSCIYQHSSKFLVWSLTSTVAASLLSTLFFMKKGISPLLPISLTTMCSFYGTFYLYKVFKEARATKTFDRHIETMQKLCVNVHKLLRFLKETEILSTGQVSTDNVGSAMFIPVNDTEELCNYPEWKTLPHIRKSLADSLTEVVNVLSVACDAVKELNPPWMNISGFLLKKEVSEHDTQLLMSKISNTEGCISLKDLQMLSEIYLVTQSDLLKWTAFCLCPVVWGNDLSSLEHSKTKVFKVLETIEPKLSNIALLLKIQLNMKTVFLNPQKELPTDRPKLIKELQTQLHEAFLLMLSMVQKARTLEDNVESSTISLTEKKSESFNRLKDNLCNQLTLIRSDLALVVREYDHIYNVCCKNKSENIKNAQENTTPERNSSKLTEVTKLSSTGIPVGFSDFSVNSPDEVFLAISNPKSHEPQLHLDDGWLDNRPAFPKTLLAELSSTLKPIKEDFKERERLALERVGQKDVENSLDDVEDTLKLKQSLYPNLKTSRYLLGTKEGSSRSSCEDDDETDSKIFFKLQNEQGKVENSLLLASLMKTKSEKWGSTKEECFSNDESG